MLGTGIEVPAVEGSSSGFVRELVCLLAVRLEGLFGMCDLRKAARPTAAALIAKTAIEKEKFYRGRIAISCCELKVLIPATCDERPRSQFSRVQGSRGCGRTRLCLC